MVSRQIKPITRAYKFFSSEFLESLQDVGRLRIGTIASFRIEDDIEGGRHDPTEGTRLWSPGAHVEVIHPHHPFVVGLNGKPNYSVKPGTKVSFEDGATIVSQVDAYVYCTSAKITSLMLTRMSRDFSYDMVFSISDLKKFFLAVTDSDARFWQSDSIALPGGSFSLSKVDYIHLPLRSLAYRPASPYQKDLSFQWQREVRTLWTGEAPREPFCIDVRAILPLIKVHKIADL